MRLLATSRLLPALLVLLLGVAASHTATTATAQEAPEWPSLADVQAQQPRFSQDTSAFAWIFSFQQSANPPPGATPAADHVYGRLYVRVNNATAQGDTDDRSPFTPLPENATAPFFCTATAAARSTRWAPASRLPLLVDGTLSVTFNLTFLELIPSSEAGGDADVLVLQTEAEAAASGGAGSDDPFFLLPPNAATGDWEVQSVACGVNEGSLLPAPRLASECTPADCGFTQPRQRDVVAPLPLTLALEPSVISTFEGSEEVTAVMHAIDDFSSAVLCTVVLQSPDSSFITSMELVPFGTASFSDVTILDPDFDAALDRSRVVITRLQGSATFPRFTPRGNWSASFMQCRDAAKHVTLVVPVRMPEFEARAAPFARTVEQAGEGDEAEPSVNFDLPSNQAPLSISPSTINTYYQRATINVYLHVLDDLSGVTSCTVAFCPDGDEDKSFACLRAPLDELVQGTPTEGVLYSSVKVPAFSKFGSWVVSSVWCEDAAGRHGSVEDRQLIDLTEGGFGFFQEGEGDVVAPSIHSFSISQNTIDTRWVVVVFFFGGGG